MSIVSIIGATTWGNTLAGLFAANGADVYVWANTQEKACRLQDERAGLQTGGKGCLVYTSDVSRAVELAELVLFAVPAQSMRRTARLFSSLACADAVLVSAAKGLEADTGKRMTQVLEEEIDDATIDNLVVLSGPNLSEEVRKGLPAVTTIASVSSSSSAKVKRLLESSAFTIYTCKDVAGVEICGALKNVVALGAGMIDGLGLGSNAKAALVTVGWQEVLKLGIELGADENTFLGFAGLGDLVATCISPLSRNYHVGYELAKGLPLSDILARMTNVAEGVDTTMATHLIAQRTGLKLPLMDTIYRILIRECEPSCISQLFMDGRCSF